MALKIRRSLPETFEDRNERSTSEVVGGLMKAHRRHVVLGVLVVLSAAVATQVGNYMTTYAIQVLHLPATLAQTSALVGGAMTFVFGLIGGWLSDHRGRKIVLIAPRVALMLVIVPMFWWLAAAPGGTSFLIVSAVIAALTAMTAAASIVVIPELLPTAFRSTGILWCTPLEQHSLAGPRSSW